MQASEKPSHKLKTGAPNPVYDVDNDGGIAAADCEQVEDAASPGSSTISFSHPRSQPFNSETALAQLQPIIVLSLTLHESIFAPRKQGSVWFWHAAPFANKSPTRSAARCLGVERE